MTSAKQRALRLAGALALTGVALPACTDWAGYDLDIAGENVPGLAYLREDVIPDPYEFPRRLPAEGTIPVVHPLGDIPPPYPQAAIDSVAPLLSNPFPVTPGMLARGKRNYEIQCAVCHGSTGAGEGTVIGPGKVPFAPPVATGAAATRLDGYLYAVIDVGRGLMPPYGEKLTHYDRWAIVAYLRQLQGGVLGVQEAPDAIDEFIDEPVPGQPFAPDPPTELGPAGEQTAPAAPNQR